MRLLISISHYRLALSFMATICLIQALVALYVILVQHGTADGTLFRLAVSTVVLFGIWVQSGLARLVGGLWLLVLLLSFVVPLIAWPAVSGLGRASTPLEALFVLGFLLCGPTYWLLLGSQEFEKEFHELEKTQPGYKRSLKAWAESALFAALGMFVFHKLFG